MGFFQRIRAVVSGTATAAAAETSGTTEPANWLIRALGGTRTSTGTPISPVNALRVIAVLTCVRVISESVSSLPLILYRRDGKRKERATEHPLYSLLHDAPNTSQTSLELREMVQAHAALRGNGYALVERDGRGNVGELIAVNTDKVIVKRSTDNRLWYDISGIAQNLPAYRVLHIRGLTLDGFLGISPIAMAAEAIGISLAAEGMATRLFENDATPPGALELPAALKREQVDELRRQWNETHRQKREIAILHSGMKYQAIGLKAEEVQFLETRKFQITEIARLFRVPPHLVGDLEKATFSNIEAQGLEFVIHTLRPWLVRWEQRLNQTLLREDERGTYFFEHLLDGLLRGDTKTRYDAYNIGRNGGWLSANDIRGMENLNPIAGGDVYLEPLNMRPAGKTDESLPSPPG